MILTPTRGGGDRNSVSTVADTTGFGLTLVHDVVGTHGWAAATASEAGGACVEVTGGIR
ncbi:hypothetical protein ACKVMT_11425 [Halobacteriales archaeon Cl-PHB]